MPFFNVIYQFKSTPSYVGTRFRITRPGSDGLSPTLFASVALTFGRALTREYSCLHSASGLTNMIRMGYYWPYSENDFKISFLIHKSKCSPVRPVKSERFQEECLPIPLQSTAPPYTQSCRHSRLSFNSGPPTNFGPEWKTPWIWPDRTRF